MSEINEAQDSEKKKMEEIAAQLSASFNDSIKKHEIECTKLRDSNKKLRDNLAGQITD